MFVKSSVLFLKAQAVIPGGVNSPARAFRLVDHVPLFIKKANGSRIWDEDGNEFIDYVGSWGSAILGHAHPKVLEKVEAALANGFSFGAPTKKETELASCIISAFSSMEKIRFVSSGTEACMTAIRIARGYTKRSKIVKFTGHYHGHSDALLAQAGSGVATLALDDSCGIPFSITKDTLSIPFNDIEALRAVWKRFPFEIAGVIFEPITGNCGMIQPDAKYLKELSSLCKENKSLLICDEVMTGFRVAWGGAQNIYSLDPDLTTLGKVIGGGMPLAAVGGKKRIMDVLAPSGPVYQAGTLSGNPVAVTCGLATLQELNVPGVYERLGENSKKLSDGIKEIAKKTKISIQTTSCGGMFGYYFSSQVVKNYEAAKLSNLSQFVKFFREMLVKGVYLPPSPYEACFISCAHSTKDVDESLSKIEEVFWNLDKA